MLRVVVIVQNESELFGRTIRVNLAKPMKSKEGSSRPGVIVVVDSCLCCILWYFSESDYDTVIAIDVPQCSAVLHYTYEIFVWIFLTDNQTLFLIWFCVFFSGVYAGQLRYTWSFLKLFTWPRHVTMNAHMKLMYYAPVPVLVTSYHTTELSNSPAKLGTHSTG